MKLISNAKFGEPVESGTVFRTQSHGIDIAYIKFAVAVTRGILIATNWELIIYSSRAKIFSGVWMKQRKFSRNN